MNHAVAELLQLAHHDNRQNNRNDGRRIAHHDHRDAEEVRLRSFRFQLDDLGIEQRSGNRQRRKHIAAELSGRCNREQRRQEIEQAVRRRVQDDVGRIRRLQPAEIAGDQQQPFEDTGSRHDPKQRSEDAGNDVDHGSKAFFAALRCLLGLGVAQNLGNPADGVVNLGHPVSDDHLELPAAFLDRDDPVGLLQLGFVRFRCVLQGKTQSRRTVDERNDIFFAAYALNNFFS